MRKIRDHPLYVNLWTFPPLTNAWFASLHIYLHQIYLMLHYQVILHCAAFYYFLQLVLILLSWMTLPNLVCWTALVPSPSWDTPLITTYLYHLSSLSTSGSPSFFLPMTAELPQVPHKKFEIQRCKPNMFVHMFPNSFKGPVEPCKAWIPFAKVALTLPWYTMYVHWF